MSEAGEKKRAGAGPDGPVLEAVGLSRSFGPIEVLSDVSRQRRAGEVHAIIGENGAGKSTLMKSWRAISRRPAAPAARRAPSRA